MTRITAICRPLIMALTLGAVVACGGDDPLTSPKSGPEALFWTVRLNHRGIVMATGQTLQLKATALNPLGTEMTDLSPKVVYTTTDTARVTVDAHGLVTAKGAGNGILVIATIHSDELNVTNADTARINITAAVQPVASFSIQPDSTLIAGDEYMTLTPTILGPGGPTDVVTNVNVMYSSEDPASLTIDQLTGMMSGNYLGSVKVKGVATIYGTVWSDSVVMTVTHAIWARVVLQNTTYQDVFTPLFLQPAEITIRKGGTIRFQSSTPTKSTVTFSDPSAVVGGNIAEFSMGFQERIFPTPGNYTFKWSALNVVGTIRVVE